MADLQVHEVPFEPRAGGQTEFWNFWGDGNLDRIWYLFLQGGWGSGKSFIGGQKLVALHFWNSFNAQGEPTYVPSAAIAPTYSGAMDFLVPAIEDALDRFGLAWSWKSSGSIARGRFSAPAIIVDSLGTHKRPSVILVRSADKPTSITGWEVGQAWGDEPSRWKSDEVDPKNDPYVQLTGRVRHPKARLKALLFTYTNEGDGTRVYEEARSDPETHKLYTAHTKDNPTVKDFYKSQLTRLSPDVAEQYLAGGAMSLRGANAYPYYDSAIHISDKVRLVKGLPIDLIFDFNINPGMHAELGQYIPNTDEFNVIREFHGPRLDVRGLMEQLAAYVLGSGGWEKLGCPEIRVFGDSSGRAGSITTGDTCYQLIGQMLDRMKVPWTLRVKDSNPHVPDRINAVNAALLDLERVARVHIHPTCERLNKDLKVQKYDERGQLDKAKILIGHASDAVGYWIEYIRPVRVESISEVGRFNV